MLIRYIIKSCIGSTINDIKLDRCEGRECKGVSAVQGRAFKDVRARACVQALLKGVSAGGGGEKW